LKKYRALQEQDIDEGWKQNLAALGVAGALGLGSVGGAQASTDLASDKIVATLVIDGEQRTLDLTAKNDVRAAEKFVRDVMQRQGIENYQYIIKGKGQTARCVGGPCGLEFGNTQEGVTESSVTKKPQPYNDPNWGKRLPKEKLDAIAGTKHKKNKKDKNVSEGAFGYGAASTYYDTNSKKDRDAQRAAGTRPSGPQRLFSELADMLNISGRQLQELVKIFPGFPVVRGRGTITQGSKGYYDLGKFKQWVVQNNVRDVIAKKGWSQRSVSESTTTEDVLDSMKRKLGDYLQDVATAIKSDPDLMSKSTPDADTVKAVKTIRTDDGHEIKIHGNEDDGFRVSIKDKKLQTRFDDLEEAVMASEMYCSRRRRTSEQQSQRDYLDEQ